MPSLELAHVDLVHRSLEEQRRHVGQGCERRAGLVGGERHDRIAFVDEQFEYGARDRCADDRLDLIRYALDAPFSINASRSVARLSRMRASCELLLGLVPFLTGEDALVLAAICSDRCFFWACVEDVVRDLHLAARLGQLKGRRVGQDLEQGIAGSDQSPISRNDVFTMPEILLLTAISRLGWMAPIASAFSTTESPRAGTVFKPLMLLDSTCCTGLSTTPTMTTIPPRSIPCAWFKAPLDASPIGSVTVVRGSTNRDRGCAHLAA